MNCLQGTSPADKHIGVRTDGPDLVLAGLTEVSLGLLWGGEMGLIAAQSVTNRCIFSAFELGPGMC